MFSFIAGAMITGAFVASTVQVRISSARPQAMWAMILAVAGAISITWAASASETCSILNSEAISHIPVVTGRPVMLRSDSGIMNLVAGSVMTASTLNPACTSLLAISAALYAAILPVMPRTIVFPFSKNISLFEFILKSTLNIG